jgi:hypothetical protein
MLSKHRMQQLNRSRHPKSWVGATATDTIEHVADIDLCAIEPKLIGSPLIFAFVDRLPSPPGMGAGTLIPQQTISILPHPFHLSPPFCKAHTKSSDPAVG